MASSKTKKAAPKLGTEQNPHPWADPYPASVLNANGKEAVFVRAVPTQDITVNGNKLSAGLEVTLGADFAHAHAAALTAPKEE